jgi:site-specific recombinase XerD
MSLNESVVEFLSGYFSTNDRGSKTRAAYGSDLNQFRTFAGADLPLLSVSGAVVEHWAAHLRENGYAPASIRRKMAALKVFCFYWVRKGKLPESPFWRVKLSFGRIMKLPRTLTERETRALLEQANRNCSANSSHTKAKPSSRRTSRRYRLLRNLALVDLLFATGMRVGEVSSLDLSDFAVQDGVFKVQGKGGRNRLAFTVDVETLRIQGEHFDLRRQMETESPALFLNAAGRRLSTQGISKILAQLRRDAGIDRHVTPHMLRHTVATLLLRNGADIRVVQEFLGHSSIATTQRYTHIAKDHLVGVLQRHHPSISIRAGART